MLSSRFAPKHLQITQRRARGQTHTRFESFAAAAPLYKAYHSRCWWCTPVASTPSSKTVNIYRTPPGGDTLTDEPGGGVSRRECGSPVGKSLPDAGSSGRRSLWWHAVGSHLALASLLFTSAAPVAPDAEATGKGIQGRTDRSADH